MKNEHAKSVKRALGWARLGLSLAGIILSGWLATPATAQTNGYQAYALRYLSAAEAQAATARLFADAKEQVEIIPDAQNRRILVSGGPRAQEAVRHLLEAVDRPAAPAAAPATPAAPAPAKTELTVKPYTFPNADVQQIAAQWQKRYPPESGVHVAANPRMSQVIVAAPPPVHAELEAVMAATTGKPVAPAAAPAAAPKSDAVSSVAIAPLKAAATGTAVKQTVTLKNTRWEQVEQGIKGLYGRSLPKAATNAGEDYTVLVFDGGEGHKLTLEADLKTNQVSVQGPPTMVAGWLRILAALDAPAGPGQVTRLVGYQRAERAGVQKAIDAVLSGGSAAARNAAERTQAIKENVLGGLFRTKPKVIAQAEVQPGPELQPMQPGQPGPMQPGQPMQPGPQPGQPGEPGGEDKRLDLLTNEGPIGPVRVEFIEGLDTILLIGRPEDVARVQKLIELIEQQSAETAPEIRVHPLKNILGEQMALLIQSLGPIAVRQGTVSVTPLGKPNALLLIGRKEAVASLVNLIDMLDQPVSPQTQFKVFPLKYATAAQAQLTVQEFFTGRTGLGTIARVSVDVRTNSLLVYASPRDLQEVDALLKDLDVQRNNVVQELKVFPLRRTLAQDLAALLQDAISGQTGARRTTGTNQGNQLQQLQQQPQPAPAAGNQQGAQAKIGMLQFQTIDPQGEKTYKSGILTDVRISYDTRSNSIIVTGPADNMDLIGALINQLDTMPAADAQIKVFTIINGDATNLSTLLQNLFGQTQQQQNIGSNLQFTPFGLINVAPTGGGEGENLLVPLRFSVDTRTNSIVASGTSGDLNVVEAILLRLDSGDVLGRRTIVYRLKNAPVTDVANAINQYLTNERQVLQIAPTQSAFSQIQSEVVVVPEPVNNSLIISTTPRYYEEIKKLVEQLDERPPMVMIQVLIAEVTLANTDEFGVELGLQDSVLFDRGTGFNFNNVNPLPNTDSNPSTKSIVAGQGLSNFGVGRGNSTLGFGGLVLSASSESVSILMRALHECRRLDVLSRPQVTTLDNQPAFIQVGQRVPLVTGVTITTNGQTNNVTLENVGLIMQVIPRISPDGLVVMQIDAEKSEVGPEAEGIPVSISATGQVVRQPRIDTTLAQTTVSALNGQTIVLGGLITNNRAEVHRRVPILAELPLLGNFFRYDILTGRKTELLIIMTPHIIRNERDAEIIKQAEAARMHWCLADVIKMNGDLGLRNRKDEWHDHETSVIYPDLMPTAPHTENIPVPGTGVKNGTSKGSETAKRPAVKTISRASTADVKSPTAEIKSPAVVSPTLPTMPMPPVIGTTDLPTLRKAPTPAKEAPKEKEAAMTKETPKEAALTPALKPNLLPEAAGSKPLPAKQPVAEEKPLVEPARYDAPIWTK